MSIDPSNGFQASHGMLHQASGGFNSAAAQTRKIMGDLEAFLQNATRTYQGSQADAFRALHFDLQDEQETIRKCLEFLTVGAQDSGTSLVTSNDQIAQDQAQLQKSFAGGSIFGGLTGSR